MEKVEKGELPGNDASWFQALLSELPVVEADTRVVVEPAVSVDSEGPDKEDPEPYLTSPAVSTDDPMQFPQEDLSEFPERVDLTVNTQVDLDEADDISTDVVESDDIAELDEVAELDVVTDIDEVTEGQDRTAEPDEITEAVELSEASTPPSTEDLAEPAPIIGSVPGLTEDESPPETTSEIVGQLWTSSETAGPLDTWEPDAMDKTISSSRGFRWTSVFTAVAVIALIVIGLVLLPSITRSRAEAHSDMMTSALAELRAELPNTQKSLAVATEPSSDPTSLRGLTTQLTALTARSSAVVEASQADLPATFPFTSSAPIDELEPIRQRVEPIGTTSQTIQRRIANLIDYRTLMSGFLDLPALPRTADSTTQTALRVVLASAQAESASILADLPSDVALAPHEELARSINEGFATWQIDYLEALRNENAATAASLLEGLNSDLDQLEADLVTPLAQIRRQADTDLIDLARSIDEVTALAKGETAAP